MKLDLLDRRHLLDLLELAEVSAVLDQTLDTLFHYCRYKRSHQEAKKHQDSA